MRFSIQKIALALALTSAPFAFSQTAGQDMKQAGRDAKGAAVNTGRATKHAEHTTGRKIKHGTPKVTQKVKGQQQ
jgi:hypothetical protein